MTYPEKMIELVSRVLDRTNQKKLKWQATINDELVTAFNRNSIGIGYRSAQDGSIDYVFSVYNSEGALVDEVTDVDLARFGMEGDSFKILKDFYDEARRQALGIDMAIDQILMELDEDIPF